MVSLNVCVTEQQMIVTNRLYVHATLSHGKAVQVFYNQSFAKSSLRTTDHHVTTLLDLCVEKVIAKKDLNLRWGSEIHILRFLWHLCESTLSINVTFCHIFQNLSVKLKRRRRGFVKFLETRIHKYKCIFVLWFEWNVSSAW